MLVIRRCSSQPGISYNEPYSESPALAPLYGKQQAQGVRRTLSLQILGECSMPPHHDVALGNGPRHPYEKPLLATMWSKDTLFDPHLIAVFFFLQDLQISIEMKTSATAVRLSQVLIILDSCLLTLTYKGQTFGDLHKTQDAMLQ